MRAGVWWRMCGGGSRELIKVAVDALSAPAAAGAGERIWSTYGFIVSRLRNKLFALRAKKPFFVHYNFGLCNTTTTLDFATRGSLAR
jgi:hypothetical protein